MVTYKKEGILFKGDYSITAGEEFLEDIKNDIHFIDWSCLSVGKMITSKNGITRRIQEISHSGKYVVFYDEENNK